MKLTIQHNIPDSTQNAKVIAFAEYFTKGEFTKLKELLSDKVHLIIYNRERIDGPEAVIHYFKDWLKRVGGTFECQVRWSAQFASAEVYFISEKVNQAYILGFEEGRVVRILLTVCKFSKVGFSIDESPYNVGFIKANAPKQIPPLANHFFCPICGKESGELNWSTGVIFKDGPAWGKKTGLCINASVCPDCNIVCEVSPDRSVTKVLSMTFGQRQKADKSMTSEQLSEYVDNTMGNKKPITDSMLPSKTNELSRQGKAFHDLLYKVAESKKADVFIKSLDKISFGKNQVKVHIADYECMGMGDESYFFIGDEDDYETKIHKYILAESSVEAAWQIYLLFTASTVMPVFWHGGYIVRKFIFNESDLNDVEAGFEGTKPLLCHDMKGLSNADLLLPKVSLSSNGQVADVYCTYWNDWSGLVRDHVQITFLRNGKIRLTQIEPLILFEYDCGILF